MTKKQIQQVQAQLPANERFYCAYSTKDCKIIVVSRDESGRKHRYGVKFNADDSVSLVPSELTENYN